MTKKEMASYLRCSNEPPRRKTRECNSDCPYFTMEPVVGRINMPYDVEIDGVKYCTGCDFEKISFDAAEMREEAADD